MKKKVILLVALLACMTTASAQMYIGGSLGFSTSKVDNGNTDQSGSSFKLLPDIGYQVDDNMSVGVQIGYSHGMCSFGSLNVTDVKSALGSMVSTMADINDEDMKLNGFSISPYIRYNMVNYGAASLFIEGYVGYDNISTDGLSLSSSSSNQKVDKMTFNAFELGLRPGVSLKIGSKLEAICKLGAVGFISAKEKESDLKITRFGVDVDSYNLLLGFNFHL